MDPIIVGIRALSLCECTHTKHTHFKYLNPQIKITLKRDSNISKVPVCMNTQGYRKRILLQTARLPTTAETEQYLANCFALVFLRPAIWRDHTLQACVRGRDCQISAPSACTYTRGCPSVPQGACILKKLVCKGLLHVAVK